MGEDLYSVLGISREAGQDEIRHRYRQLAKELHPDLNPGDARIAERFRQVNCAHAILADPRQRARYDLGEIDESGQACARYGSARGFGARAGSPEGRRDEVLDDQALHDLLADLLNAGGDRRSRRVEKGEDALYRVNVSFLEAAKGTRKRVAMDDGRSLDMAVPAGIEDGKTLRLKGKGRAGVCGGPPGDALVEIHVQPHPLFERRERDVHLELPVSLPEAVLGARIDVPTIDGPVTMTVPKGANTGTTLRLKERGIAGPRGRGRGDQYVRLKIMLPQTIDPDLADFLQRWSAIHPYDPRTG